MFLSLVLSATLVLSAKPAADPNDEGFAAYKAGDLKRAKKLFEAAQQRTPKNAWAWLNWARVVVREQQTDPEWGGCAWRTVWAIQALVALDRALELSGDAVQKKIDADEDGALAPLKRTDEYRQWVEARKPLPETAAAMTAFLAAHPEWHEERGPPRSWVFDSKQTVLISPPDGKPEKATWRSEGARIVVMRGKTQETFTPVSEPWFFDEGKKSYRRLRLNEAGQARELYLDAGLVPGDCP